MDYRRMIELKGKIVFILICTFISSFILLPNPAGALTQPNGSKRNMFYIELLNYVVPVIKVKNFDMDDMAEKETSFKDKLLDGLGIDITNPTSIIRKEISYFQGSHKEGEEPVKKGTDDFNAFKLNENEISKISSNTPSQTPTVPDVNLPNLNATVYDPTLKKSLNVAKPEVFIYHTHTTESYLSNLSQLTNVLNSNKDVCDTDQSKNVCAVGEALKNELEKNYGVAVVHDVTVHDALAYTQSYARSAETMDKYLKKYGDFKVIIDLHRDSVESRAANIVKFNGENVAKFMFVMAKKNPHYGKNMQVVNKFLAISNRLFPGLAREPFFYNTGTRYFNQGKSNNAVLIEVGSHVNTTDEAKNTSKYLARIIAEYLSGRN